MAVVEEEINEEAKVEVEAVEEAAAATAVAFLFESSYFILAFSFLIFAMHC